MAKNLEGTDITGVPTRWQQAKPSEESPLVKSLEDLKNTLDPAFTALTALLNLIKGVLEVTVNLLLDFTDANKIAIEEAIDAIRTVIDDLAGEAGCYFMAVPIIPINKELADTILYPAAPGGSLVETLEVLDVAVRGNRIGSGGNYGFLSTVADSLIDVNDTFKPTFGEDAHVAGVVVYFGAESYLKTAALVNRLITLFSGPGSKGSGMSESIKGVSDFPKPKGLRAEIAPSTKTAAIVDARNNSYAGEGSPSSYAVKLSWDPEVETHVLPWPNETGTGNETWKITHVMVFRNTKLIPAVTGWTKLDSLKIKEYEFDDWEHEFYDEGIELGNTYYYAVGYKMAEVLQEAGGGFSEVVTDERQPFNISITAITLPLEIDILPRGGTPPDWSVMSSPLSLVPAISHIVRRVHATLDTLEKTVDDKNKKMRRYIKNLEAEINRYIDWMQEIVSTTEAIIDSLNWTGVYAGATGFSGKGGNGFMLSSLGTALNDQSDPNRPPFDKGTEAVCGFILYAGSSTAGGIEKFIQQVEFLFGVSLGTVNTAWEDGKSAWNKAAETIDVAVEEITQQICLSDDLISRVDCSEEQSLGTQLNESLEPSDEDSSCAEV